MESSVTPDGLRSSSLLLVMCPGCSRLQCSEVTYLGWEFSGKLQRHSDYEQYLLFWSIHIKNMKPVITPILGCNSNEFSKDNVVHEERLCSGPQTSKKLLLHYIMSISSELIFWRRYVKRNTSIYRGRFKIDYLYVLFLWDGVKCRPRNIIR